MSVEAKRLIAAKYAASSTTVEYTTPADTRTIIDKFTASNTDASARTVTVYLVPVGETAGATNIIVQAQSVDAGVDEELEILKNHILEPGETIEVVASVASKVVIRASGREVT